MANGTSTNMDRPEVPPIKKQRLKEVADELGETPDEPGKDNSHKRLGELLDTTVQVYTEEERERRKSRGVAAQMPNIRVEDVVKGRVQQVLDSMPPVLDPQPIPDPPIPPPDDPPVSPR